MLAMRIIILLGLLLITHGLTLAVARNPFSFAVPLEGELVAHGVIHDKNIEFSAYVHRSDTVRVEKKLRTKSPST
jgi:hypothetical protein